MDIQQILQQLQDIRAKLDGLDNLFKQHTHSGTDSVYIAIPDEPSDIGLPNALESAPLSAVTGPSGGATIDSQARTAITTIISRLQTLGLIS